MDNMLNASEGEVSLHEAAAKGLLSVIRQWLADGGDIEGRNTSGQTALHVAAVEGQVDALKLLMAAGADINAPLGELRITALHMACYTVDQVMVETVLNYKPDVEARVNGVTPLFTAVSVGNADIVRLLFDAGADVRARTTCDPGAGESVLHLAVAHYKTCLLPVLLQHGADANAAGTNPPGQTALHIAAQYGNVDALRILVAAGADASARYADGTTALHLAAYHGHVNVAKALLEHGLDISDTDQNGDMPLYAASIRNQHSMLRFLLDNGAGNIPEQSRNRIAISAAASAALDVLQMLEGAGFDILAKRRGERNWSLSGVILRPPRHRRVPSPKGCGSYM